jgi:oxygen-independent coproporphyrinogen III oxidase
MRHNTFLNYYSEPVTILQSGNLNSSVSISTSSMPSSSSSLSLYLHIPFCTTKCTYCAFNTYTHLEVLIPAFVEALTREIEILSRGSAERLQVGTIFFGGGTPTLLTAAQFEQILNKICSEFDLAEDAEITIEANPNDLSLEYLCDLRQIGINRLSIGMQSSNAEELKLFARRHDYAVVQRIMPLVREAGFDNINLDLIYGVPIQTLDTWRETLGAALAFSPEHLSLYALGLEDGTPLKDWVEEGRVTPPDDDLAADMYELATELLAEAGYIQYEISNWSKPGRESRHNLQYWQNLPYAGVGPGAHGFAGGVRYATILSPQRYIKAIDTAWTEQRGYQYPHTPATIDAVTVDHDAEIAETLIMGLRLTQEGIKRDVFQQRFGIDLLDLHGDVLRKYEQYELIEYDPQRVRLTSKGRLLSNMIFRELV